MKLTAYLATALVLISVFSSLPTAKANNFAYSEEQDAPEPEAAPSTNATKKIIKGSLEMIVCFTSGTLAVRSEDLNDVLFRVKPFQQVKVFQGWGTNKKSKRIEGVKHKFVRVQFPDREDEENIGWISDRYIKAKAECAGVKEAENSSDSKQRSENDSSPATSLELPDDSGKGLSGDCCRFPIAERPTQSFLSGTTSFGVVRKTRVKTGHKVISRLHAGCDLYFQKNEPILAVTGGKVIRDLYFFYEGTYALEVRHSGGFIVRYGEMTGKKPAGTGGNRSVTKGQQLGYMGKVDSNCCEPMLHFELYSGKATGSLTQRKANKFERRSDLLNPTKYLLQWETNTFSKD